MSFADREKQTRCPKTWTTAGADHTHHCIEDKHAVRVKAHKCHCGATSKKA